MGQYQSQAQSVELPSSYSVKFETPSSSSNVNINTGRKMGHQNSINLEKVSAIANIDNMNHNVATKRKTFETATPAPPFKKATSSSTTSKKSTNKQPPRFKTPRAKTPRAPRTPAAKRTVTPFSVQKSLGRSAIARLTEKASNGQSRDLQPIRRPLPAEDREWNSEVGSDIEIDINSSSSSSQASESEDDHPYHSNARSLTPTFNQDLSDSDMSTGISENENGIPRAYDPRAPNPDPLHPFSKSAKYRVMPPRGIVRNADGSTVDFDSCMTFPDAADMMAAKKKLQMESKGERMEKKAPGDGKQVLLSFSDNIATPEMNWILRKNNALVANTPSSTTVKDSFIGEFLDSGLDLGLGMPRTRATTVKFMDGEEKGRGKGKGAQVEGVLKKKVARQPKYQKRTYKWKDVSRKNKGRLYDEKKMVFGEGGGGVGGGDGGEGVGERGGVGGGEERIEGEKMR
ncbi:hypothetical protein WAI453_012457 [Rhynchosporium graminicola]